MIAEVLVKKAEFIRVHYDGWDKAFDEEIRKVYWPSRLAPLNTHTSPADGHDSCCAVCREGGDDLLLCDGCPQVYHIKCAGLSRVPQTEQWFCHKCDVQKEGKSHRGGKAIPKKTTVSKGRGGRGGGGRTPRPTTSHLNAEMEEWVDAPPDPSYPPPRPGKENQNSRGQKGRKRGSMEAGGGGRVKHLAVKNGSPRAFEGGEGVQGGSEGYDTDDDVRVDERKDQRETKRVRRETPAPTPVPSLFQRSVPLQFKTSSSSSSSASSSPTSQPLSGPPPTSVSPPPPPVLPVTQSTSTPSPTSPTPVAAGTSSRKRVQVAVSPAKGKEEVTGDVAPPTSSLSPPPPLSTSSQPSPQNLLDYYRFAYDKKSEALRTPLSSSPPPPSVSPPAFPVSKQGTPANIPALSFPPICLLCNHRQMLEDFCRFVDVDPAKPVMHISPHVAGIDRWRMLMERLNDYRRFLQGKINQRMNSSNDERIELTKRRQMTESTYTEAKTRFRSEEEVENQQLAIHRESQQQLRAQVEEKEAELRALRERLTALEAEEVGLKAAHQLAKGEREETKRDWEDRLRGIDENREKLTTLLHVLQALRDHIRESKKDGGEAKEIESPPWEPYHTVLTTLQKLEGVEAKRKGGGSPSKGEQKEERREEEKKSESGRSDQREDVEVILVEYREERKEPPISFSSTHDELLPSPPHLPPLAKRRPPTPLPKRQSTVEESQTGQDPALAHFEHKYDDGGRADGGGEEESQAVTQPMDEGVDVQCSPPTSEASASLLGLSTSSPAPSLASTLSSISSASFYPSLLPESVTSTQTTVALTQPHEGNARGDAMRGWVARVEEVGHEVDIIELDDGDDLLPLTAVMHSASDTALGQWDREKGRS